MESRGCYPHAVPTGLTTSQAEEIRARVGANVIERRETTPLWRLAVSQFTSPLVALLLVAVVVAAVFGEYADAIAIAVIVVLNGLIGFVQEFRAERAMQALESLTARRARALRDGALQIIPAAELVPGDVLALEAGDVVAADARVLEGVRLELNEAPLTGESAPVAKRAAPPAEARSRPLAERSDHVFMGTSVVGGTGLALVESIAGETEIGKIAGLITRAPPATPLQRRLDAVGRMLIYLCVGLVLVVAAMGAARGMSWHALVLSSISLAVAAVPEGLPAVVTIALAIGMQRMARRHVLVRRLASVETLGSVTVICTDKTGTLTTGIMEVRELWGPDERALLRAATACCDAELRPDGEGLGDPTEVAILRAAAGRGILRADIEREAPRVSARPFDAELRRMWILREDGRLYLKGAVEVVLPLCAGGVEGALAVNEELGAQGRRVLAVAVGEGPEERELTLVGLLGIADPPRREAIDAIRQARGAGVQLFMLTGDHQATATAIARELELAPPGRDPAEYVRARVTAAEKDAIVGELQGRGEIVAMTGDGVNDAPAIRRADIGVAMGEGATEVTREVSDMVLTDDDLGGVIVAIREGRIIYENIQKTIVFLLSGNLSELMLMLAAAALGLPLPLLPLHLLWINLLNEPLPAIALVLGPASEDVLERPPRAPDEPILGRGPWLEILAIATLHAAIGLAVFWWALEARGLAVARSLSFSTIVFGVLLRSLGARSRTRPIGLRGALENRWLLAIVGASIVIQIGIHYLPSTRALLQLEGTPVADLLVVLALGLAPLSIVELVKLVRTRRG